MTKKSDILMNEDDLQYLFEKFPSMKDQQQNLLKGLLKAYQNEDGYDYENGEGGDWEYWLKRDVYEKVSGAAAGEVGEDESAQEEQYDKNVNSNDDGGYVDEYYMHFKPWRFSPWFSLMQKQQDKADYLIMAMIEKDGKNFLMKHIFNINNDDHDVPFGILNMAIFARSSFGLIDTIVNVGGPDLLMNEQTALYKILRPFTDKGLPEKSSPLYQQLRVLVKKMIELGGYSLLHKEYEDQWHSSARFWIKELYCNDPEILMAMTSASIHGQMGPSDVVLMFRSILHQSGEVLNYALDELVRVGKKELIFSQDYGGNTVLHYVGKVVQGKDEVNKGNENDEEQEEKQQVHAHLEIQSIQKLIEFGGKDLVLAQNEQGMTALHYLCCGYGWEGGWTSSASAVHKRSAIIESLIKVGGKDVVNLKDDEDKTALDYEINVLHYSGVRELHMDDFIDSLDYEMSEGSDEYNEYLSEFIHDITNSEHEHGRYEFKTVQKLIEAGGKDLVLAQNEEGKSLLHKVCARLCYTGEEELSRLYFFPETVRLEIIEGLIKVGGKELLSMKDKNGMTALYYELKCSEYGMRLVGVEKLLTEGMNHYVGGEYGIGGLFNYASLSIQQNIYSLWHRSLSALKRQSFAGQPILHAALFARAPPKRIIQSIIKELEYPSRDRSNRLVLNVAAKMGLEWSLGMKELVEKELEKMDMEKTLDEESGFYPYMLAAEGVNSDLNVVFDLARRAPELVKKFESNEMETRKRKQRCFCGLV